MSEIIDRLRSAIKDGDKALAVGVAEEIGGDQAALDQAVKAAVDAVREVGDLFGAGECFLPEMVLAAEAMQGFMGAVGPELERSGQSTRAHGKVALCTVKGDIHTIGKDIVATILSASGFDVIDLGADIAPIEVIESAEKARAQIIALSALMTTSMPYQKEVIDMLRELGIRDRFWVIVGGGPVTADYAERIGADGWGANAGAAARLCERLLTSTATPSRAGFVREER